MTEHDATLPIFELLTSAATKALLKHSVERRFTTGDRIWSAGDRSDGIALVLEGKVRVVRVSGDRQTVIHSGQRGDTLGEVPFFTNECYPATAIAAEPTRCLFLTHAAVTEAMAVDSRLAFFFLKRLSQRVQGLVDRVDQNTATSVQTRLARFILDRSQSVRASRRSRSSTSSPAFSLGATQTELAEELGTVREVLVRALRGLRDAGAIERAGDGKYRVTDVSVLRHLSQSS